MFFQRDREVQKEKDNKKRNGENGVFFFPSLCDAAKKGSFS